ncbi:MAG: SDR family NAD(P)-dependent oxidoreductase [Mangrovibacterium sp.]
MKTALITAATKGLGKTIALHLAELGWNIAMHYFNSEKEALKLYNYLEKKYPNQEFGLFQVDLQDPIAAEQLVPETIKLMPSLDLLINNAAIIRESPLLQSPFDLIEKTMQLNYIAPIILTRDFARLLPQGSIINMHDMHKSKNNPNYAAYVLSKDGLANLTKLAASEFSPNISVNSISFGTQASEIEHLNDSNEDVYFLKSKSAEKVLSTIDSILANKQLTGQIISCDI